MEWIELGELGKVSTGNTPSKKKIEYYNENYIELVKPSNFTENMIVNIESGEEYLSKEGKSKGRVAEVGDILVTCIGNIGNVGIVSKEVCFNQQINSIKVDKKKVLSKYTAYAILYIKPALNHVANKAVVPIINKSTFEKIKIPVPSMKIQKKIVEVLDEAQKLIYNRKKQIKLLDDLIESIFYDMFGDPVKNDKGWEIKKLDKVSSIKSLDIEGKYKDDDLVWLLNLDEIESNTGKLLERKQVKFSELPSSIISFNEDYVLYSKLRPYLNKLILPDKEGYATSELVPILPKKYLNKVYLFNLLRSAPILKFLEIHVSGAKMPRVVMKDFRNLEIPIPPLPLQNQFAEKVQAIEKQKELLQESLKLMEDNYNSLMQRAFKGELF